MCHDEEGCCTLRCKALFLGYWCVIHGLLTLILNSISLSNNSSVLFLSTPYFAIGLVIDLLAMAGGICMLFGIYRSNSLVHLIGLIISWLYPVFYIFAIYLLVIHIIFTICAVRYRKQEM